MLLLLRNMDESLMTTGFPVMDFNILRNHGKNITKPRGSIKTKGYLLSFELFNLELNLSVEYGLYVLCNVIVAPSRDFFDTSSSVIRTLSNTFTGIPVPRNIHNTCL